MKPKNHPNTWQIPDRHGGKPFNYLRVRGQPNIPLPRGSQRTPEFLAAYRAALAGTPPPEARPKLDRSIRTGTWKALMASHLEGDAYRRLIKKDDRLRAFKLIGEKFGDALVAQTDFVIVGNWIDKLAQTTPGWARILRSTLSILCGEAIRHRLLTANPIRDIKRPLLANTDGHHDWLETEIAAYKRRHERGTLARYTLDVLLELGLRLSDAAIVGDQHLVDDNTISLIPQKTKRLGERARVFIPISDELVASRAAMTVVGKDQWLVTVTGKPFSGDYLGDRFAQWCDQAGLPDLCTAHGLRKSFVRRKIDAGIQPTDVAAMTGHQDLDLVMFYARQRDKRLAAERVRKAS